MRITISIDATQQEAALLLEKLREVFGDRAGMTVESETATPGPATPAESVTVTEKTPPDAITGPSETRPPGRGQIFRNPQLTGDQVVYGEWQVGPPEWGLADYVGVSRPGGETQAVRTEHKRPDNSFEGYDRYLSPAHGSTAIEMGGAFRVFTWEFRQTGIAVQAGYTYDLEAVFHPLVKTRLADGREVFMGADHAGDWMANLEWRWVARSAEGQELGADEWQDGETLGRQDFDLPFDQPHHYRWTWRAPAGGGMTFGLQFRNKWALAMTKVWLHQATCTER